MNEKTILEILLTEFREKLKNLDHLIPRDVKFPEAPNKIKVAIGMRRAGKTYVVYEKILQLLKDGIPLSRILYLNFEDDRLLPLSQEKLAKLIEAFYSIHPENHEQKCYLFLDEIQNATEWPLVIRRMHDSKNVEIFLTGSSAKLLSKEIATSLRGRSLATEVWPYSFHEFMRSKQIDIETKPFGNKARDQLVKVFHNYLSEGGFPEVTEHSHDIRQKTLQEYVDIVLYRDIIERYNVANPSLVKYMILSMIHNVSNPFSINKFYNEIRSRGYKTGKDVLYEYAEHIEDAYLAFSTSIYDRSIKRVQSTPKKVYAIDSGLIRATTLDFESDLGKLFENIIYLDLKRLGYEVQYYLTKERYEIDFIATSPRGDQKFFQVVWDMDNPKTREREERALEKGIEELKIDGEIVTLESYLRGETVLSLKK